MKGHTVKQEAGTAESEWQMLERQRATQALGDLAIFVVRGGTPHDEDG